MLRTASFACALLVVSACGADETTTDDTGADTDVADTTDAGSGDTSDAAGDGGADVAHARCDDGSEPRAWESGETGPLRHELAGDFELQLDDDSTLTFSEAWSGCDSWIFIPDTIPVSDIDSRTMWVADVGDLIARSPENVHYVFLSRRTGPAGPQESYEAIRSTIDAALDELPGGDANYWGARLHVAALPASMIESWIGPLMQSGHGQLGFSVDRFQRVRGLGSFADVTRYDSSIPEGSWPWQNNLGYAAHEARRFNAEYTRQQRLDAENAVVVPLWTGEVISQFADMEIELPSAEEMARFDRLEIDVEQRCPDANAPEIGNCGAWDYIAHLSVFDGENRIQMGKYITTYHREARMIVDASHMLPMLSAGGLRTFRWEWAPEWNVQPTSTLLSLRFIDDGEVAHPVQTVPLFTGGEFNSAYNATRLPIDVEIPADAARVEVWAVITGHGAATEQCAEFCDHEHAFAVNGTWYTRTHPLVGDQEGCITQIENQMTPNQWGTWWFGRGGWCPGQQVDPWIIDVTDDVTPGEVADVRYRGAFRGDDPPDGAGNIDMVSWLVIYR
jgi:hypothetical protein